MAKKTKKRRYNSRELTNHLRELAAEVHDWIMEEDGEGKVITKGEALANLLWERALGYDEVKIDDEGNEKRIRHEPAQWAIQLVYERLEGRAPQAVTEDETRRKAKDRVDELAKQRINALATAAADDSGLAGPPKYKPKKKQ